MGDVRAAFNAGKKPPTIPISAPATNEPIKSGGLGANENDTSCQVEKFIIETRTKLSKRDATRPTSPPTTARNVDSTTNENRIANLEKPSARNVPTSRFRCATAANIVFIAPSMAPNAQNTDTTQPMPAMNSAVPCDCSS